MATPDELQELRDLAPPGQQDDGALGALLDEHGLNGALAKLWAARAAKTSSLVDVTESGSSRKMSQLSTAAAKLAADYRTLADAEKPAEAVITNGAVTRPMTR